MLTAHWRGKNKHRISPVKIMEKAMEFKGNLGKRITTEENYVVIKHKSFAWGSYEKQVPYCTIKAVEIAEPSGGTAGYIRLVENGDERVFNQKKGDASFDTNLCFLTERRI